MTGEISGSALGSTVTLSLPLSVLIRSVSLSSSLPAIVVVAGRPPTTTESPERVTATWSARSRPFTVTVSCAPSPPPPAALRSIPAE
jgi:hypothetical protein